MLALNVGSGQRPFVSTPPYEWVNVDINPKWNPDKIASGSSLPYEDNSVDLIVSHHCIEHVGLGGFDAHIREAHRVLTPWGSLIITTPDLRALVDAWIAGKINDYIFNVNLYGAYMDSEADRHKWLYTKQTLIRDVKNAANWWYVHPYDFNKQIPGANIAKDWYIQGVEAVK